VAIGVQKSGFGSRTRTVFKNSVVEHSSLPKGQLTWQDFTNSLLPLAAEFNKPASAPSEPGLLFPYRCAIRLRQIAFKNDVDLVSKISLFK
jgi:hypothetical protein